MFFPITLSRMRTLKPVFFSLTAILGAGASWVFARAGGGEGYSGGGDPGGFGGAPSGDGFSLNFPEASPLEGGSGGYGAGGGSTLGMLVVLLVILALLWFLSRRKLSARRGPGTLMGGSSPVLSSSASMPPSRLWTEKSSRPPSAEALRMLQALPRLFVNIQKAWSDQNLERVRREISDGVFSRWQIQIDLMRREGRRNLALQPRLLQTHLLRESREGEYEAMDILIRASLVDFDLREGDTMPTSEKSLPPPTIFEEVWSFTRKRRAPQPGQGDAMLSAPHNNAAVSRFDFGSNCVNCAAPLAGTQGVKCPSCGAILNSGAYDWVLAEITQVDVWTPGNRLPGQGLSRQEIEDRASTVFVRLVQSHLENRPGLLRPYAEEKVVSQLQRGESPLHGMSLQKIAIGKVEWETTESEDTRKVAKVRVKFSGGKNTMLANPQYGDLVMVFAKTISSETESSGGSSNSGLNALNCPQCGAPVGGSEQARCGYCNETLNNPEHHWVLTGFESH